MDLHPAMTVANLRLRGCALGRYGHYATSSSLYKYCEVR